MHSLLTLPDEILVQIVETLFHNAKINLIELRPKYCAQALTNNKPRRPNILQITEVNRKLRDIGLNILADDCNTITYFANELMIPVTWNDLPEYWSGAPMFSHVTNLTFLPHQTMSSTGYPSRIGGDNWAPVGIKNFPRLKKLVLEYHRDGALPGKKSRLGQSTPTDETEFVEAIHDSAQAGLAWDIDTFVQGSRLGHFNGILDIEFRYMGQMECNATITNGRIQVEETGSASKETWTGFFVDRFDLLPIYAEQMGTPLSEDEMATYQDEHPGWA